MATLSGLTDVSLVNLQNKDVLLYTGTTWLNYPTFDLTSNVSDGQFLYLTGNTISGNTYTSLALSTAISNETAARVSADSSLSTAVSTANYNRTSGDTSLSTAVSTANYNRTSGDTSLSTQILTTNSTTLSRDNSLSTNLSTELVNRSSGDTSLSIIISTNLSTLNSSDTSLSTLISTESSTRLSGDNSLSSSIISVSTLLSTDVSTLQSSDTSLSTLISSNLSTLQSTDVILSTEISTNLSTLNSSNTSLSTLISSNLSTLQSSDTSLSSSISSETSSRLFADTSIMTIISAISGVTDWAGGNIPLENLMLDGQMLGLVSGSLTGVTTASVIDIQSLSTSISTVSGATDWQAIDLQTLLHDGQVLGQVSGQLSGVTVSGGDSTGLTSLSSSISTEVSDRISNDSSLSSSISIESSTRLSGDNSLSTLISTNTGTISTHISQITSLSTVISTETSNRIIGDNSLSTAISTEESKELDIYTNTKGFSGFPDRTNSTLSFGTGRTFYITGTNFPIYLNGVKTLKNTQSITLPNTTGLYWIWYSSTGVLSSGITGQLFSDCLIANVYFNTTQNDGILSDERHHFGRDPYIHEMLHDTIGERYESGGSIVPTNSTFSITETNVYDEDIAITIPSGTTCKVMYKNGNADWRFTTGSTTLYYLSGTSLTYNTGNTLATLSNNEYACYWVYATNNQTYPIMVINSQYKNSSIATCRTNSTPESLVFGNLPAAEMKLMYRVMYRQVGTTPTYIETADYRNTSMVANSGTFVASDHLLLTNIGTLTHTELETQDTSLSTAISTETSNRTSGDTSLSTVLSTTNSTTTSISTALTGFTNLNANIFTTGGSYTLQSTDNGKIIQMSGTSTLTLPNSLITGFQVSVINVGTNTVTLSASTTLLTKSSKVTITTQYSAVSLYHKGSNIWMGFGDLT